MIFSNFVKLISGINYDGNIIILNEVVYHELDGYLILDIFENHDIFPYLIHPNKTKEWHVKLDKIIPNRDGMFPFSRSTKLHRFLDSPAIEYPNGDKEYWRNGQRHRTHGPAVIYGNKKYWFEKGEFIK